MMMPRSSIRVALMSLGPCYNQNCGEANGRLQLSYRPQTPMTLNQDLRFAVRILVKDKWFTLVAILALALGIGVNTTVFTFVNAVLIRGLPFPDSGRILHINTRNIVDD